MRYWRQLVRYQNFLILRELLEHHRIRNASKVSMMRLANVAIDIKVMFYYTECVINIQCDVHNFYRSAVVWNNRFAPLYFVWIGQLNAND